MKRFNKVLLIILICLLASCGVALTVLAIVDKTLFDTVIAQTIDILNKPLPIVGITVGAVLLFIWRLIVSTNYGKKKLAEYDAEILKIKEEKKEFVDAANCKIKELENKNKDLLNKNSELKSLLASVCALSTNKKIKDFGKAIENGKETIDTETETE